jgi:LPS export ABC transporter protein LptC
MRINLFQYKFYTMAALLTGCFFVYSCENSEKQIKEVTETKELVEEAKNIEALLSQEGVVKAKLKSPLMLRHSGKNPDDTLYAEFPKTLHVDFFDSTSKIQSWLDSKYGKYFETLNKVFLKDSVITINTKGDTLKTDELWWDQQKEKFYTDKPYQLNTPTRRIHGSKGLEASQDFSEITFNEPEGVVQVSQSGFAD